MLIQRVEQWSAWREEMDKGLAGAAAFNVYDSLKCVSVGQSLISPLFYSAPVHWFEVGKTTPCFWKFPGRDDPTQAESAEQGVLSGSNDQLSQLLLWLQSCREINAGISLLDLSRCLEIPERKCSGWILSAWLRLGLDRLRGVFIERDTLFQNAATSSIIYKRIIKREYRGIQLTKSGLGVRQHILTFVKSVVRIWSNPKEFRAASFFQCSAGEVSARS